MCGIFGLIDKTGPVDPARVRAGTAAVHHRGPDGNGIFTDGPLGLGHTRLAIIDTGADGAQPMRHRELPLVITFNGEIYNYLELRDELIARGHCFHTHSDTEVLLTAYLEWGEACVSRFNGMWAFAIFDGRDHTLFCARDRFGVKPFYYCDTPRAFAFGSEIRQLLPIQGHARAVPSLIDDFLVCGLTDHTNDTFFAGIHKLPAGHTLRVCARTGRYTTRRFYTLTPNADAAHLDTRTAPQALREMLADATRLRLRSDVRVGTCLSGGLDSSSVATLAAELHRKQSSEAFKAITAISEQASNTEEPYAARVVDASRLDWIRVTPRYADFAATLDTVIDTQEEPFGGPSISMQYFVMQAARAHGITVLLDGQGGDETLLGYERYYPAWLAAQWRDGGLTSFLRAARQAIAANANTPPHRLAMYLLGVGSTRVRSTAYRLRYPFLHRAALPQALIEFSRHTRDALAMQALEITCTNLPMLLRFEDKNSMRFGVEARLPFLDYRLVEFALGLPLSVKLHQGWTKWVLRSALAQELPSDIAWRRNKFGFNAPDAIWLEAHRPAMREATLGSNLLAQFLDLPSLAKRYDNLDRGMRWRLFCLARWAEIFKVETA